MPRGMSQRQYAEHSGLSKGGVQKAKESGRLVIHPDGSIDAEASDRQRGATTDPAKQRRGSTQGRKRVPQAAVASVGETLEEHGLQGATGGSTFMQAKTANEVLKAQERRLKVQQKKQELVDRAKATDLVFRLARQERESWVNWPARVSAEIAAELGIDPHTMEQLLNRRVRQHLDELAEVRVDFQ